MEEQVNNAIVINEKEAYCWQCKARLEDDLESLFDDCWDIDDYKEYIECKRCKADNYCYAGVEYTRDIYITETRIDSIGLKLNTEPYYIRLYKGIPYSFHGKLESIANKDILDLITIRTVEKSYYYSGYFTLIYKGEQK